MSDKLRAAAKAALEELIASESNAWNIINDLEAALAEPDEMSKLIPSYDEQAARLKVLEKALVKSEEDYEKLKEKTNAPTNGK